MTGVARWSRIADRARTGCKGPNAAAWLQARSLPLPPAPNTWVAAAGEGCVARLGSSEFFVEATAPVIYGLDLALASAPAGVYPVLRADAAFLLEGDGAHEVLAQVCNVNFAALELGASPVVMTLMIGVGVLVLPQASPAGRRYRIWCDPSFGEYLDHELSVIIGAAGHHPARAAGAD
jgi:sarcosine oxidase subunit gamma